MILNAIAQHPYAAFSLFIAGVMLGFFGLLRILDARANRQIDAATAAAGLRAAASAGSRADVPWRDQVRSDVQRYRALQGGRS
jgi:hypothetical protein